MSRVNSFKRDWSGSSAPSTSTPKSDSGSHDAPIDLDSDDGGADKEGTSSWPASPEASRMPQAGPSSSAYSRLPSKASGFSTNSSQSAPPSSASDPNLSPKSRRRLAMGLSVNGTSSSAPTPTFSTANGVKRSAPNDFEMGDHLLSSKKKLSTGPVKASDSNLQKGKSKKKKGKIELSEEQKKVLDMVVKDGKNVFFTGSAGTGKSVLLREIITALRVKYQSRPDAVAVTASTGIAACNVGGTTLHSFAGIGLGTDPADKLAQKIRKSQKHLGRWTRTKVLIIDEVSMVDGDLFDKLAKIGTIIRRDQKPFGGIQLIVTGDFFQLPPVSRGDVKFAFEARMWKEAIAASVNLTQVFRQKDPTFVDMLTQMRFGQLDDHSTKKFQELSRPVDYADGIMPTELYPRREDVDTANSQRLNQLHTETIVYTAKDRGSGQPMDQLQKELNNLLAVPKLTLKVDAQAMLIKNLDDDLVNGSIGIVMGFFSESESAIRAVSDWEDGSPNDPEPITPAAAAVAKRKAAAEGGAGYVQRWPLIRFSLPGGGYREQLIMPEEFKIDEADGTVKAAREQLPLILSWAMSIHKSQGQTLERVKVDLRRIFEKGQAYVALSRATSLEQLQVLNFEPKKVMCHAKVVKFTHTLEVIR